MNMRKKVIKVGMDRKELVKEINEKFYLILTLSIFFPVLLYYIGKIAGETEEEAALLLLKSSSLVGLYLLDYILFQLQQKTEMGDASLRRIDKYLLIMMIPFITPILIGGFVATKVGETTSAIIGWVLLVSIGLLIVSPVVIELLIIFGGNNAKPAKKKKRGK